MIHFYVKDTISVIAAVCAALVYLTPPSFASEPPARIVTTTSILADSTRRLADPRSTVISLMGERVDPHTYKASPGDLRTLSQAHLIITNGLHLEGRLADALEKLSARKTVLAAAEFLPKERLRYDDTAPSVADPHVWFDVSLWMSVVQTITQKLIAIDPERSDDYQRRSNQYLEELHTLHAWCLQEISKIPRERRLLVTAHDAFGYLGRAYDIEVHGIQGMSTDSEASVRDINMLVELLVTRKVPAIFIESSVSPRSVEALLEGARARGAKIVRGGELFSDALGAPGTAEGTYVGMVRHNVREIVNALGKGTQDE